MMFHSITGRTLKSRKLELVAGVTTSWKQWRWRSISSALTVLDRKVVLKDKTIAKCLLVSSYVTMLEHEVEQQLLTWKQQFQLLQETHKQPFAAY